VGFAAESQRLETYAESKRKAKNLALVVGNLVQDGLGGETNQVILFDATGAYPLPSAKKIIVARGIVAHLASLMEKLDGNPRGKPRTNS
jgi:phosphopantothenoylcysteine decarboxylase/phosphopantothenate--cysteine ligase